MIASAVVSRVASQPTQAITSDLAVGYAIQDAQQAKAGEFTCVLQGLPTRINGAQMTYREAQLLLGALPDPVSGDDRPVWLIVLRGDIAAQSLAPPIPTTPKSVTLSPPVTQVYQQMGTIVDAEKGDADMGPHFETTCRPTTGEIPTEALPELPQPQGTLPLLPVLPERAPAPTLPAVPTNSAVPSQVVLSPPAGGP